jgi:hypothetical protein
VHDLGRTDLVAIDDVPQALTARIVLGAASTSFTF